MIFLDPENLTDDNIIIRGFPQEHLNAILHHLAIDAPSPHFKVWISHLESSKLSCPRVCSYLVFGF